MNTLAEKIQHARSTEDYSVENYPYSVRSIAAALSKLNDNTDGEVYVYYDENGARHSFSGEVLYALIAKTAAYLSSFGLGEGDRVVIAAHNHSDTIIQYLAAWSLGLCVVPLNMSEDDNRLAYIISNAGGKLLIVREEYHERLLPLLPADIPAIVVYAASDTGFWAEVEKCEEAELPAAERLDTEALIVYTSGTTGNPKGVVLTQSNLIADGDAIASWHSLTPEDTTMCVLPIHHVNGTIVTHIAPLLVGAKMVLLRKFKSDTFFPTIEREGVTIVSVVPTLLAYLLEHYQGTKSGETPPSLRHIICGAGPLTCELARRFEEKFAVRILHGYGLSETTCYSCFLPIDIAYTEHCHWQQEYGFPSIGVPIAANMMSIHDEQGQALPPATRGEIVIRGTNVMKEYYNNPAANESTFAHGWFRSGDEGFFINDEQGRSYFFITGRIKELIIRGGVNLAPLEIDEVLCAAPGVKAGIAVGFENDFYGEEIGALVIGEEGATEEGILQYCRSKLPFSKTPKVVVLAEELPVTTTGKYQRNKVKHLFAEWKNVQYKPIKA